MADDTNFTSSQGRPEAAGRGNRQGGGRDSGGFRIRLSDNEMQAARALQEAFNLRSTVAVLGFSLRSLAQLLEEGKLDELVAQQRAQGGGRPPAPRGERGERRGDRERPAGGGGRAARVDPFARPARPAPAPAAEPAGDDQGEPGTAAAGEDTALSSPEAAETAAASAAEPAPTGSDASVADAAAAEATSAS